MRYGEMTAFEERPHSPYYGAADATPLYVVLLDEYERWTGDHKARPRAGARGPGRAALDRRVRRPAGQRLRLVPAAQRADRPGEPVLEGLLGLDLLPRRPPARLPASDLRAAGLRLRRQGPRRPAGAPGVEGRGLADGWSRQAAELKHRFNRDFWVADGEYYALALDPEGNRSTRWPRTTATCSGAASSTSPRRRRSRATWWARGSSPAGACARWPRARRATTRSATTSARSGRSTTRSSPGACAATASRTRRPDRRRHPRRGRVLRGPPARGLRRLPARADQVPGPVPDGVQPAGLVDGRAAAAAADDARPRTDGRHLSSTRRCRPIGRLELLDIPGRWGRIDAFGRGRVDVDPRPEPRSRAKRRPKSKRGEEARK